MPKLSVFLIPKPDMKSKSHRVDRSRTDASNPATGVPEYFTASADPELRQDRYRAFLEFLPDPVFVFNLDNTVSYLNPAFEQVFGWTLKEWKGKQIPFIPKALEKDVRAGVQRLFREKVLHGFETQRLTRDGRLLDVLIDAAVFYDENDQAVGKVVTYRDITRQKRMDRSSQALFRIAKALYQFRGLDKRLDFITRELQKLMAVGGALVILIDEEAKELFFRAAAYDDTEAERRYKETRYPLNEGVAGEVLRTGKPMIVPDYYNSPYSLEKIDRRTGSKTSNMLQVPMMTEKRMIGTLCVVNKREGDFDQTDVNLLSTVASIVALPIVNARINEQLEKSYAAVKSLNRAKDRVIHHLSHELKTPVAVLDASLNLLGKKLRKAGETGGDRILERARRNLHRILDMQYEIQDILRDQNYTSYRLLNKLLDACTDEIEMLVAQNIGEEAMLDRIRHSIKEIFGPENALSVTVRLDRFVMKKLGEIRSYFAHRNCRLVEEILEVASIRIPEDVLDKVIEGLVRNAFENTPNGGEIVVAVSGGKGCVSLTVSDSGVGITDENQRLIFENYFTSYETMQYSSGQPFEFGAGGKGFDLLRMKIFSERYHFDIGMVSQRCRHLSKTDSICPGDVTTCGHINDPSDCSESGGTAVTVTFPTAERLDSGDWENGVCIL